MNLKLKIPGYWLGLAIGLKKRENISVLGVCNKVGHHYVPFLDYDNVGNPEFLIQELRSLQTTYGLGNAYLFQTTAGYHVIFLDLLTYQEWKTILWASSCDEDYKTVGDENGSRAWVLRLSAKKENKSRYALTLIAREESTHDYSHPHLLLLKERGVPQIILESPTLKATHTEYPLTYARYTA